ncbi:MAG: hypothetical protein JWR13_2221 [Mycobacterium sp.]|jgi:hypothetical protein|nr:hypothetical protein [Mycobacterium sp.]MDT5314216.1 hypothetical protein [Mycobacterium sp.]
MTDASGVDPVASRQGSADPNSLAWMTELEQPLVRTWWPWLALLCGVVIIAVGGFLLTA